ncbi:MAG: hypothetical protein II220_06125 [Spirochaetales bacterium]|nr:hypothetical protein [Spirochaetales bacterium]
MSSCENISTDLKNYYMFQAEISEMSELFGQNTEHVDKVILLFAEIYAFICDEFSIEIARKLIMNYENSDTFKRWFWEIKHRLGEVLGKDPTSDEIGCWIGQGAFLKIVYNILCYRASDEVVRFSGWFNVLMKAAERQQRLLKNLTKLSAEMCVVLPGKDEYLLLNEKMVTNVYDVNFKEIMAIH